jgi:signal recognition particle GTPase
MENSSNHTLVMGNLFSKLFAELGSHGIISSVLDGLTSAVDARIVMIGLDGAGKTTILYAATIAELTCLDIG